MKKGSKNNSLLSKWKNREKKNPVADTSIKKIPDGIKMPLSLGQKRLWFLQQMYPENSFYNLSEYYVFQGYLDVAILEGSLNFIFKKHKILKSYYEVKDGEPFLKIDNSLKLEIEQIDYSKYAIDEAEVKAETFLNIETLKNFDISKAPLIKIFLLKISDRKHILLLKLHHIIADQWSMQNLKEELAENYEQLLKRKTIEIDHTSIDFIDFAYWQSTAQSFDNQISYWKKKLNGDISVLNLPTDFNRPTKPSYEGKHNSFNIPNSIATKALELAKKLEVTPFVFFLSAYFILLQKFSQQEDILIGTPSSNRDQNNLDKVFGLFIDTLVLRTSVKKSFTIFQLINEVKLMFSEALSNKNVPFDTIVKNLNIERSLSINPIFQVMFVYTSKPENPSFGEGLKLIENAAYNANVSKFDITLFITENKGEITSTFEYATDLFDEETINRFQYYLLNIVETMVNNIDHSIESIPVLTRIDETLIELNNSKNTNSFNEYQNIHSIIESVTNKYPNNVALTFGDHSITYKEFNDKANTIAQELLKKPSKHKIVGLCIERSLDMMIGLLGILKSGCAYLPIDPEYPQQRIDFMLRDANVHKIITQSSLLKRFEAFDIHSIVIDDMAINHNTENLKLPEVNSSDLAYVIYTSGSTGQPKGVPITHGNIINSTAGRLDFYDKNPDAFLLMSSISFDSSKAGIFWTLCTAGNLVIAEKRIEQDLEKIANIIQKNTVTHTLMLPSLYKVILENIERKKLESLNTVMVAGEACPISLCKLHFETLTDVSLYNEYGPTEASVWCIAHKIEFSDLEKNQIPIGKPVANAEIYILNADRNKVPFGVSGELYIGGNGLSKGYLNRPDLTNTVFIKNPFSQNEKLYKTGDLAKYNNDGTIQFLGRTDQQIKIRGYRVELDDIENTINKNILVEQSVVLVKQKEDKPKRLVAYLKPKKSFDEKELKTYLKKELPDYMIPSSFVLVDTIPLLPNGKIDKKALSKIEVVPHQKNINKNEQPKNKLESQLLEIWKNILNIEALSTTDNFFEIGGDSILSIQIIAKARKEGIKIAPNQIFEHQTISELAIFVGFQDENPTTNQSIVLGNVPLTPIQKWFFETHKNAPEYWNQGFKIKDLPNNINQDTLRELTINVIKNHDALRSSFSLDGNKWQASILKPEEINAFSVIDISNELPSNYDSKIEITLSEIQEKFALKKGSLFKCIYFDTGIISNDIIVLLAHHLVIDFVSWQIILNDYMEVIHSETSHINKNLKTSSIKTWGNHLLQLSNSETIQDELEYWKTQIPKENNLPLDFECELPIYEKDINSISIDIATKLTENLINEANKTYNTKIDELLLTAYVRSILNWSKKNKLSVALERHGRETENTSIDLSNTAGWFTSFFPKQFSLDENSSIDKSIIAIKEQMRNIPNGGVGYGILRYLNTDLGDVGYPETVFNFLGKQSTGNNNIEFISNNVRHPKSERYYYIEVNALIKDGILNLNWSYANQAFKKETIELLIENFNRTLEKIVEHCLNIDKITYTPSDFEEVDLDQDDLDSLLEDLDL